MIDKRCLGIEALEARRLLAFSPTAAEQEFMQLTNRFRTDPRGEFSRLISAVSPIRARDPVFQTELNFYNVNGAMLKSELQALQPVPPVAWNEAIYNFARAHNAAMINARPPSQFHSNSTARRQALLDAGVNLRIASGETITSENVYGHAKSPMHLFASYIVDWGNGPGGMQTGRLHRKAVGNDDFEQAGHALTSYSGANFGPLVSTQVLANIENPPVMVVGAVFEDKNDSGWYEAGEGVGGVRVVFSGAAGTFTTNAMTAGGYQLELPSGTYTAIASGGRLAHPVVMSNIVVGASNVWANLIYDPDAIPPDALEPNDSRAAATATTGRDQVFSGLSIHLPSDLDFFQFKPQTSGEVTLSLQFTHAAGNLDLRLLNASGGTLATSSTTGNTETIRAAVTGNSTYYVQVYSVGGAVNGSYKLSLDAPEPRPPLAVPDRATVSNQSPTAVVNILANDSDPDGDRSKLLPRLASNAPSSIRLNTAKQVQYTAPANFSGFQRTTYTVTDEQGLVSAPAALEFLVINFQEPRPWQNKALPQDVNGDNRVSPLDVLLIVNDLNADGFRQLPSTGSVEGYVGLLDTNGDGLASALDVLTVLNYLNGRASGEGPPVAPHRAAEHHDQALLQMMAVDAQEQEAERARGRRSCRAGDRTPS